MTSQNTSFWAVESGVEKSGKGGDGEAERPENSGTSSTNWLAMNAERDKHNWLAMNAERDKHNEQARRAQYS